MTPKATPQSLIGHYSGFTSRALAFLIDGAIIAVTFISVSWIVSVTITMLQVRTILGFSLKAIPGSDQFVNVLFGPTTASILTVLYILGYYMFFLILMGQTPGKVLMGLRVVRMNGGRLNAWHAFVRTFGYAISAIPLYLGFLWVFVDDRRQAWHDKLAGTCVIYTWAARPDERFLVDETKQFSTPEAADPKSESKSK